ncbi:MAG: 30S ribosomal protein S16 [Chlamydiia bacterium]|nr:30S ribosomal protein S16 [Chlamydiia bacterium]MCH9617959.1 30S ribosomal protein S16 [Chlamydiia bacterium]MCH9623716.1 30S ribosomal protein S16 [Chlamydiia bacterium]
MALSMRMRQQGRKNKRMFRFVVADSRSPRDGKYIDCVGHYDPHAEDGMVVDKEKIGEWLKKGVQPSDKMLSVIKKKCPEVLVLSAPAKK